MSDVAIPDALRRFIVTSVPSVPFVEAMLIFRESGATPLDAERLAARLYIDARSAAGILAQLRNARIVEPAGESTYRYAPSADLAPILDELAARYRSHLVEVAGLIHSSTGRMAQRFADAFKWRKD